MQSFTAKPSAPVTVQAIQYIAADGAGEVGNLDELKAVADVCEQNPWNPAGGQNYATVTTSRGTVALEPGGWLVIGADGAVDVASDADMRKTYDAAKA